MICGVHDLSYGDGSVRYSCIAFSSSWQTLVGMAMAALLQKIWHIVTNANLALEVTDAWYSPLLSLDGALAMHASDGA